MKEAALALTAVAILTATIVGIGVLSCGGLQVLMSSWFSGEAKAMDRIVVTVPSVPQVSYCYVAVRRLPTLLEPTEDGYSQLLFFGRVNRGGTVTVEHVFNATPVTYGIGKPGKAYARYYEPKDYIVSVICFGSNGEYLRNYSYSWLVEVTPRKLVNIYHVPQPAPPSNPSSNPRAGEEPDYMSSCNIVMTREGVDLEGPYKEGYCDAWVAFMYVNSVPGLKVAVKFPEYPPTGIYFTAFSKFGNAVSNGGWEVSGRRVAYSLISGVTDFVSDGERELILVKVRYKYEYHEIDGPDGNRLVSIEQLYPSEIIGIDDIPAGRYVEPGTHPPYAMHAEKSYEVSFGLRGSEVTDEVTGVSTSLTVGVRGASPSVLTVNVYKAVRSDRLCSPPHLVIRDYSNEGYWWWFKNDDPLTYTVLLKRG